MCLAGRQALLQLLQVLISTFAWSFSSGHVLITDSVRAAKRAGPPKPAMHMCFGRRVFRVCWCSTLCAGQGLQAINIPHQAPSCGRTHTAQGLLPMQIVKSESATARVPELDFEIPSSTQKGTITTVEGLLSDAATGLRASQVLRNPLVHSTYT